MLVVVQIKAGLRVAVQPHGGHFWSSMGQVQRPMDIVSLRIDNQVRFLHPVIIALAFALTLDKPTFLLLEERLRSCSTLSSMDAKVEA